VWLETAKFPADSSTIEKMVVTQNVPLQHLSSGYQVQSKLNYAAFS
jgi:hypothetical protein